MAKTIKSVETTIIHEISVNEIQEWLYTKKLIPEDWKFFSVNLEGLGVSQGVKITLKNVEIL